MSRETPPGHSPLVQVGAVRAASAVGVLQDVATPGGLTALDADQVPQGRAGEQPVTRCRQELPAQAARTPAYGARSSSLQASAARALVAVREAHGGAVTSTLR